MALDRRIGNVSTSATSRPAITHARIEEWGVTRAEAVLPKPLYDARLSHHKPTKYFMLFLITETV